MRKEGIPLLIILLFFVVPFVVSDDFKGYKYPGDEFRLNGDNFSIKLSKDWKSSYLSYNKDEQLILSNNSCKETEKKLYLICFKGSVVDFDKNIGKIDDQSGETVPGLNLTISYRSPEIILIRNFSKINPLIMEAVDVNITIENIGRTSANVDYYEVIPRDIEVTALNGLVYDGGNITYSAALNPGMLLLLKYKLKPLKNLSSNITGNITVSFEAHKIVTQLEKIKFRTNETIVLTKNITNNLSVEDYGVLRLGLKNKDNDEAIRGKVSFALPKSFKITGINEGKVQETSNSSFDYEYYIESLGSREIIINFTPKKTGQYNIPFMINYTTHGINRIVKENLSIKIMSGKINASIITSDDEVMGNQLMNLKLMIRNTDDNLDFYDISAKMKNEVLNRNFSIQKLPPNSEAVIFEDNISIPNFEKVEKITLNISGVYMSINNENFTFSTSKTIKVTPPSEIIVITHEFNKYINDPDKAKITVYVENKRDVTVKDIEVKEKIPSNIKVLDGDTRNVISISPKRKSQVYTYTIQTMDNKTIDNIITSLTFKDGENDISITQPLKVNISSKNATKLSASTRIVNEKTNKTVEVKKNDMINAQTIINKTTTPPRVDNSKKTLWQKFVIWLGNI